MLIKAKYMVRRTRSIISRPDLVEDDGNNVLLTSKRVHDRVNELNISMCEKGRRRLFVYLDLGRL